MQIRVNRERQSRLVYYSEAINGCQVTVGQELKDLMFLLPSLIPKTLEELASKPDQAAILARKEAELKEKWQTIRDYKRGETPLGVPQQSQAEEEEDDDDDADDDMTEEEEEEEQDGMEEGDEEEPQEGEPEEGDSDGIEQY